jgi:hypothetical protein
MKENKFTFTVARKYRFYWLSKALFIIFYLLHTSIGCTCSRNPPSSTSTRATTTAIAADPSDPSPSKRATSQGIPNIGNSCYMNASLQALAAFYGNLPNPKPASSFTTAAKDLVTTLTDTNTADRATLKSKAENFFDTCSSAGLSFPAGTQQDASELLITLLNKLKAPQGVTNTYLTNPTTGEKKLSTDAPWTIYNVALKPSDGDKQPLQYIFDRSLKDQSVTDAKWDETDTEKKPLTGTYKLNADTLKTLPVFPIHVGRFANVGSTTSKINTNLTAPFKLVIKQKYLNNATAPLTYELSGFIEHQGSTLMGGHYVTYIKEGEKWILYDDRSVSAPSQSTVEKAASNAYILFYKLY